MNNNKLFIILSKNVSPVVFISSLLILFLRRPDVIIHAQFWAEDGYFWYSQLYNLGLQSLFSPENGYFQTISRLTMILTMPFGIIHAPLISNLITLVIRSLLPMFLFTSRFSFICTWKKIFLVMYYLLMPNTGEVHGNITNIHWFLALYILLILIAVPANNKKWHIHDFIILVISSLSGPFSVFVIPYILIKFFYCGIKQQYNEIIVLIGSIIQIFCIVSTSQASRSASTLDASFSLLSQIVSSKIIFGAILNNSITNHFILNNSLICILLFLILSISLFISFIHGKKEIRGIILFVTLMLCASLSKPMISMTEPQWPLFLLIPNAGERYFIISNILFFSYILYLLPNKPIPKLKNRFILCIPLILIGITIPFFRISPLPNQHYEQQIIEKYYPAPVGSQVIININPPGWTMQLIKK